MSIKWLFFDVGSTLLNEEDAQKVRFKKVEADIEAKLGKKINFDEFSSAMEEGATLRNNSPFSYATKKFGLNKKYLYSSKYETIYPEAKEVLTILKSKFKIGIIANQPPALAERIKVHGLSECVDAVFGSDDVGLEKPGTEIYAYALSSVGCKAEEAVMIGDRLDNDIIPAKKIGMKTIRILQGYFSSVTVLSDEETPDYTITSLMEILDLFENI